MTQAAYSFYQIQPGFNRVCRAMSDVKTGHEAFKTAKEMGFHKLEKTIGVTTYHGKHAVRFWGERAQDWAALMHTVRVFAEVVAA